MITTFYPPYNFGGDGVFIYRLSNELARLGHNVDVIHCIDSYLFLQSEGPKGDFPNHKNVRVHGLKSKLGIISPFLTQQTGYPFFKKRKIEDILKKKKFDVIHYHNISLVGGPKLLSPREEITLYTTHEHWLVCPMHVLWKYNKEVCKSKDCFVCSLSWKRPPQLWRYTNMLGEAVKNVNCFLSPSKFTLRKHHEMGLKIPIVNMPYFLPLTEELSSEIKDKEDDNETGPYFLFVGRLEKIKGVQGLIKIFKDYSAAKLLIAGDGEYGDDLKKLAEGNSNVVFLGRINHKELQKLYRNAIALIVSSICYEVFGIIIMESFSMKTPVITNNLGALPEVVEESGGGFVYNNSEELIRIMESLRTEPETRKRLSENGYNAYRKLWTEENCLKIYFDVISKLKENRNYFWENLDIE